MIKKCLINLFILFLISGTLQAISKTALVDRQQKINAQYSRKSRERQVKNIVKNYDFKAEKANWRLHRCSVIKENGVNVVELNQPTPKYTKVWQTIKLSLPAGTIVRIEAKVKVENIYKSSIQENKLPQLFLQFLGEEPRKSLYAPKQAGRGFYIKPSNGKFKTITLSYKVPAGATSLLPSLKMAKAFRVLVKSIKVFAPITLKQAAALGLATPSAVLQTTEPANGLSALERAKKSIKPNELYPVIFPHTINIDGNKADWQNIPLAGKINYSIPRFAVPNSTKDFEGYFKATADDDFIYLLVVVKDDKLNFGKNNDYNDDSIEIFFSPTLNQNSENGPLDFHMTIIPKTAELLDFNLAGTKNYLSKFRPMVKLVKVKDGWGVEVAVPLNNDLFVIKPYDMLAIGFNIEINDNDSGKRDHKLSWAKDQKEVAWRNPSVLGVMLFLSDEPRSITPPTSATEVKSVVIVPIENNNPGSINIIRNGSFDDKGRGWSFWGGSEGTRHSFVSTGKKTFLADGRGLAPGNSGMRLLTHGFAVIPGEKYLYRFKVKTDSPNSLVVKLRTKTPTYGLKGVGHIKVKAHDGWLMKTGSFIIPANYIDRQNIIQLMFDAKSSAYRLWLDEMEVYRYIPEQVDANLLFDSPSYAFPSGEPLNAVLALSNRSNSPQQLKVKISLTDVFHNNNPVENRVLELTLARGQKRLKLPLKIAKAGLYELRAYITNPATNKSFVRGTEFAVYHKPEGGAKIAGAAISRPIYTKDGAQALTAALAAIKIGHLRMFVPRSQEYEDGKFDFTPFNTLVDAAIANNIDIVGCVKVFDRFEKFPVNNLDNYERYISNLIKASKGKVAVWEIGNETDLWMGWPPRSDPYEYSLVLRTVYNVIKSINPQALVATAGFNKIKLTGYIKKFLAMNRGNFFDIFAFHPYCFLGNSTFEQDLPDTVKAVAKYSPNPVIYDTESGVDNDQTKRWAVEVLTKKIPMYLLWNIRRHYEWGMDRFSSGHLWAYYAAPGIGYPVYAFINSIYANAKCEGEWQVGKDFKAIVFNNQKFRFATIWRNSFNKQAQIKLAVDDEVRVYDILGNDITIKFKVQNGKLLIKLLNKYPIYVCGVLPRTGDLTPPLKFPKASKHEKYATDLLLLPLQVRNAFNISLPAGDTERIPMRVKNYSRRARQVTLKASSNEIQAHFEPNKITIPAGKSINTTLIVKGLKQGTFKLQLGGSTGALALAPLPMTVKISFDCILGNLGRFISLKNNTPQAITGTLSCVNESYHVTPYNIKDFTIPAKSSKRQQVIVVPKKGKFGRSRFPSDGIALIEATFTVGKNIYRQLLKFSIAKAERIQRIPAADKPWLKLWSGAQNPIALGVFKRNENSFTAKVVVKYDAKRLYLAIAVNDQTHYQKSNNGYVSTGDSVIIGIDPNYDSTEKGLGKNNFEAGFALRNDGRIVKYYWNGKYGLESTKEFKAAQATIFRRGERTYYNLVIPLNTNLKSGKSVGFSMKIVNRNRANGKVSIINFGDGLEEIRDASAFGNLLLK